jgi:multiple antibiotic resistance protein
MEIQPFMNELLTFAVLSFVAFFTLINPVATMPVFMTMTASLDNKNRARTAKKASIAALITLLLFAFSGTTVVQVFWNISEQFQNCWWSDLFYDGDGHASGAIGYGEDKGIGNQELCERYLNHATRHTDDNGTRSDNHINRFDGAGGNGGDEGGLGIWSSCWCLLLTYIILLSSTTIIKLLGETGNNVLMRLMGLIVMVIAVEFFFSGLKPIVLDIMASKP